MRNIRKVSKDITQKYAIEAELIKKMTDPRPEKRPSAKEILNSETLKRWALDAKYE